MGFYVHNGTTLVDPMTSPEITCSGIGRIEFTAEGLACFVLYRRTLSPVGDQQERQICGRIFAPLSGIPECVDLMLTALKESGLSAVGDPRIYLLSKGLPVPTAGSFQKGNLPS